MKTKILFILLCLISNIGLSMASIESGECGENGNNCTYSFDTETGVLTISGNGNMKNYSSVEYSNSSGHSYDTDAPWKKFKIVSVMIEEGVTSIGTYAFCGGHYNGLYNDTYATNEMGKNLMNVTIANSVTNIGDGAFIYCIHLTSVNIPNSVRSIGNFAFECCSSLASVTIPNSVTSIGGQAFSYCSALASMTIPNSVVSIGDYAFRECVNLTSIIIPNSVISLGDATFNKCSALTSVTIGNSVTSIGREGVFSDCSNLTSVTIGNSVTSIGNDAFWRCTALQTITIPQSVSNIDVGAFGKCSSLETVYCESRAVTIQNGTFYEISPSVYVPQCAYTTYQNAPYWKDLTIVPIQINMQVSNNVGGVVTEECGSMEVEAIPFEGYQFKKWLDGNKENPRRYLLSQSNLNFIAQFEIAQYTINLNCDVNQGSISGDKGKFNHGTDHTIEAVPNNGYHFTQWSDGETENPREFTLVQDTTFTALFAQNQYSLSVTCNSEHGSVDAENGQHNYLSEITISAAPKEHYKFVQWSDGVTENPRTIVLTKDTILTAEFAWNVFTITWLDEEGNVLKTDEVEDGETPAYSGETPTKAATTEYTYEFAGWLPKIKPATKDICYTTFFERNKIETPTYTVNINGENCSLKISNEVPAGTTLQVEAVADECFQFQKWSDNETANPRTINVTEDANLTAEFNKLQYTITGKAETEGGQVNVEEVNP